MGAAIQLSDNFVGPSLRAWAKRCRDEAQARRLTALTQVYDAARRSDVARLAIVTLQIIQDGVEQFNAEGADGLLNGKGSGPPSRLDDAQRTALKKAVNDGPKPNLNCVVRWHLVDLAHWVWEEIGVSISRQTPGRKLRVWESRRLTTRPQDDAQDPDETEAFKKLRRHGYGHPYPEQLAANRSFVPQ